MSKENMAEDTRMEKPVKKSWINRKILAIVVVVLLIAGVGAAVGIGIYNMPENRVARQLQTAYKYLQEGDYEKAALAFEQVIAVDKKCIEAYAKGIEAYIKYGDEEKTRDLFERAMEQIGALDEELLSQNMEHIVDIYLSVEDVYGDDSAHMAEILEKGLEVTKGDEQIRNLLVVVYLELAERKTGNGLYEDAMSVYDRLLELDGGNMRVLAGLADCLNAYIEVLMNAERYNEVRALADKYAQIPGVDFAAIIQRIEELTRPEEEPLVEEPIEEPPMKEKPMSYTVQFRTSGGSAVETQLIEAGSHVTKPDVPTRRGYRFDAWYLDQTCTRKWNFDTAVSEDMTLYAGWIVTEAAQFLQKVFDLMAAENYSEMLALSVSNELKVFVEQMDGDHDFYVPNGQTDNTGVGVGVYLKGKQRFFYYGDYVKGIRKGSGTLYGHYHYRINQSEGDIYNGERECYEVFTGNWERDMPNGQGGLRVTETFSGQAEYEIYSGNLVDGLWDGYVDHKVKWTDMNGRNSIEDASFYTVYGTPDNKVEELNHLPENPMFDATRVCVYAWTWYDDQHVEAIWSCRIGDKLGVGPWTTLWDNGWYTWID